MRKKEKFVLFSLVFIIISAFIFLIPLIFRNCIWEWPPRLDLITCIKEQWPEAVKEAVEFP